MYSGKWLLLSLMFAPPLVVAEAVVDPGARSVETVIVIGANGEPDDVRLAGSVDLMTRDELAYEIVDDTLELFTKIPGVYIARYNQGIINTDIAIRGFAGDGGTPHAKLLVDGIPSNLHNGNNELDQLFPVGIASIEVFKGTSDARYGLYNVAGNYRVSTRQDVDVAEVRLASGSYDSYEASGYWGVQTGSVAQNYFVGYRTSGGYRDNSQLDKYSLSGRWEWEADADNIWTLIARLSGYDSDAPGYLSGEEARDNPRQSALYASQDGGDKVTQHLSLHWDKNWSEALSGSLKAYAQNFERERWVRFSEQGSLQNRYDDQDQLGVIATLSWQLATDWRLDWGLDAEFQDVVEQRFGTQGQRRERDAEAVLRDHHYQFDSRGTYLLLEQNLTHWVTWNAAIRADQLRGDITLYDAEGNATAGQMYDFGTIVQPKANLIVSPLDELRLFANYGRSFQHPFGAGAYTTGDSAALDVSVNDGWEAGARWSRDRFDVRWSYWRQTAKREFVVVDGEARNVGETDRQGWDLALNWHWTESLYWWANYGRVNSEIITAGDAQRDWQGNELRSIPSYSASVGVNYEWTSAITARLHLDAQGDAYVNEMNTGGRYGGFRLLNFNIDYQQPWGSVSLQVNNLLDEYYAYVYDFSVDSSELIHSPGDGVNGTLAVTYRF